MSTPALSPVTSLPLAGLVDAPWMWVAKYQMALWNASGMPKVEQDTDWDEAYFTASPYYGGKVHDLGTSIRRQNLDWCAAFVNYCLHRAGYSHTGSAGARSFLRNSRWRFEALDEPRVGCVIVVGPPNGQHVGFLASTDGLKAARGRDVKAPGRGFKLLGGNQSNTVKVKNERRDLVAARDLSRNRSPYLWPLRGNPNCNIGLTTAASHFCGHPHKA